MKRFLPIFLLLFVTIFCGCNRVDSTLLMQKAVEAIQQNRLEAARECTAQCLKVNPEYVEALLLNNYCSFLLENNDNARRQALYNLAKCTKLAPELLDAWYYYGWALVANKQSSDAILPLERAYALLPATGGPRSQIQLLLGLCYAENNLQAKALSMLQPLQFRKPYNTWPELYNQLGLLALKRKQPNQAITFFKRGLQHAPDNDVLLQNLAVTHDLYRNDLRMARLSYRNCLAAKAKRHDREGQLRIQNRLRQLLRRQQ